MSSLSQKDPLEDEGISSFKINDGSDSELFILDEVGCFNSKRDGEEPEILFIKETPGSRSQSTEPKTQETIPIDSTEDDDEPEVIYASEAVLSRNQTPIPGENENEYQSIQKKEPEIIAAPNSLNDSKPDVEPVSIVETKSSDNITIDFSGLFCLDTTPEASKEKPLGPRFCKEFRSTLKYEEDLEDSTDDAAKSDNRCFNCQGDHTLQNCPNPRNQQEISKNRSIFMKNQPKLTNRYHVDKPTKFERFKPGVISQELRDALGLRSSEIPLHIYQMRLLGYPPGWLEEIKEYSSGLDFIDSTASPTSTETNQTIVYDYEKVINYPGFNVALSKDFRDDWRYLNFPPMQWQHSKEHFVENLKKHSTAQMKHSSVEHGNDASSTNLEIVDMDTSIEELEEQRKALLAELGESESSLPDDECSDEGKREPQNATNENGNEELLHSTNSSDVVIDEPTNESESNALDQLNHTPKQSKFLAMGTPVSIRYSPYSTLPARDKFAQNMGELELFENLPTSTGAFQKMRSLLQKVRTMFKKK